MSRSVLFQLSAPVSWMERLEVAVEMTKSTKAGLIRKAVDFYLKHGERETSLEENPHAN